MIPHTSQWFEALMLRNTQQALHTMRIIELSNGDLEVCSICGDKPVHDYIALGMKEQPNTIRLCDDCLQLQGGNSVFRRK
jgi:hypothetical protein